MMNNQMPLLQVTNLRVNVAEREVVKGISFSLAPREVLAVVGESGSGKLPQTVRWPLWFMSPCIWSMRNRLSTRSGRCCRNTGGKPPGRR